MTAKVSIGMPVYNRGDTINKAIDSLLNQSYKDFELIISDNASSDQTELKCREYLKTDGRIRYFRQKVTTNVDTNFQFVLDHAVGEYFMWAAADDYWFPDFIKENLQNLQNKDQFAGSISKVIFKDKSGNIYPSCADSEISGSTISRIKLFLSQPSDNSRIYSLFKKEFIKDIKFNSYRFHAVDWFIIYKVLLKYRLTSTNEVLMCREKSDEFKYFRTHLEDNSNWITLGLPLFPFTLRVILCTPIFLLICIIPELLKLNYRIYNRYRIMRVTKKNV